MLSRVREHLAPGGRFLVDAGFKQPKSMADTPEEQDWFSYTDTEGREVQVTGTDHYDHIQQIWHQTFYRRWQENDEPQSVGPIKLVLRYFMPQEMESLLSYNGFTVLSRHGDWTGNPLTGESHLQIYICKQRA